MKHAVYKCILLAAALSILASCLPESDYMYSDTGMYTVISPLRLKTDSGSIYNITDNSVGPIADTLKRVMARCEVLRESNGRTGEYDVRIVDYMPAFVRDPLPADTDDTSVGHDGVKVTQAWIAGGYLNSYVNFTACNPTSTVHDFHLLYDALRSNADTLFMEIRHNAMGECPENETADYSKLVLAGTYLSFPIDGLIPAEGKKPVLHLAWDWYIDDYVYNKEKTTFSGDILIQ